MLLLPAAAAEAARTTTTRQKRTAVYAGVNKNRSRTRQHGGAVDVAEVGLHDGAADQGAVARDARLHEAAVDEVGAQLGHLPLLRVLQAGDLAQERHAW